MTVTLSDEERRVDILVGGSSKQTWIDNLIDARIELGLCQVGRCTLRLRDVGFAVSDPLPAIGSTLKVSRYSKGTLFEGVVTGVNFEADGRDHPTLTVVAHDNAHQLALQSSAKSFENTKFSAVVSEMLGSVGLTADVDASEGEQEAFLRHGNWLSTIDALAERLGWDWWCEGSKFSFKKPPAASASPAVSASLYRESTSAPGPELLWFDVRASSLHPSGLTLRSWDRSGKAVLTGSETTSSVAATPVTDALDGYLTGTSGVTAELTAGGGGTQTDTTAQAKAQVSRWAQGAVTARGELPLNEAVKPGVVIKVDDAGSFSGQYHVTAVEHLLRGRGYTTRFVSGPRRPRDLVSLLGSSEGDELHFGSLRTAVVSDLKDPDSQGRVKVAYQTLGGTVTSAWARVALPGAGKDHGFVALPEVDDEVLVGFELGDLSRPVVLGGLFSSQRTIPTGVVDGQGTQLKRVLKSNLGHVLEMGDGSEPAAKFLTLQLAGSEGSMRLGADKSELKVADSKELKIAAGSNASITFGTDGSIAIKATKITLEATSDVSVKATGTATVHGLNTNVEADVKVAVKGEAQAEVTASGALALKGGIVQIN